MIYPDEKWNPKLKKRNENIMNDLLEKSLESNPDVIVWPEAALTSFLAVPDSKERIKLQEKIADSVLITGIPQRIYLKNELKVYNSAIFLRPDGFYDTYQKVDNSLPTWISTKPKVNNTLATIKQDPGTNPEVSQM